MDPVDPHPDPEHCYKSWSKSHEDSPFNVRALPESLVAEDCSTLVSGHVMLLLEHVRRLLNVLTT